MNGSSRWSANNKPGWMSAQTILCVWKPPKSVALGICRKFLLLKSALNNHAIAALHKGVADGGGPFIRAL